MVVRRLQHRLVWTQLPPFLTTMAFITSTTKIIIFLFFFIHIQLRLLNAYCVPGMLRSTIHVLSYWTHQRPSDVSTITITSYRRSSEVSCLPKITQLIGDSPCIHLRSASITECCKLPHFISIHCYLLRGIITPLEKDVKDQLFQEPLLAQNFPRGYLKP